MLHLRDMEGLTFTRGQRHREFNASWVPHIFIYTLSLLILVIPSNIRLTGFVTRIIEGLFFFRRIPPCSRQPFRMPHLDYWCSLEITGPSERAILMLELDGDEDLVECLIEERRQRRVEIEKKIQPLEIQI